MNIKCNDWKDSYIFPEYYSVSRNGEVWSKRTNKLLKPTTDKDGYLYYVLCVNGQRKTVKAHRLVALTYIDNPFNKPAIDHINGIKTDNRIENLKWVTNKENTNNPITLNRVIDKAMERMPKLLNVSIQRNFGRKKCNVYKNGILIGQYNSQHEASKAVGVSEGKISQCINGQRESCKGFTFSYLEEEVN